MAACLLLLLGGCAIAPAGSRALALPSAEAEAQVALPSLVASRRGSVVGISTLRIGRDASEGDFDREFLPELDYADQLAWPLPAAVSISQIRDFASGVILTSDGVILTSAHVVANIDEAHVRLDDGRRFPARVLGADARSDVALLKIEAAGLQPVVIGASSSTVPGDWVAAIGAPFGLHGSVTSGVVSAVNRFIDGAGSIPFIQTDAAINPGSSGSPLFNARGEVIAINSLIFSGSGGYMGLSFAVPIDFAMQVAAQLQADGRVRRSRLGAEFQEVTPALAESFGQEGRAGGALTVRVEAGGPAQAGGLARGDIVTALDDAPVGHFTGLLRRIAERPPGSRARLAVWREGAMRVVSVTLAEEPAPRKPAPSPPDAPSAGSDGLGLSLSEPTPAQLHLLGSDGGLMVREAAGAARSEGIRAGDLIVAVNGARLNRLQDFRRSLSTVSPGRYVALLVLRERRMAYVAVRLGTPGAPP